MNPYSFDSNATGVTGTGWHMVACRHRTAWIGHKSEWIHGDAQNVLVVASYKHSPACWVQHLGQTGFCLSGVGFGFVGLGSVRVLGSRHPT